jgi:ribonuclease R
MKKHNTSETKDDTIRSETSITGSSYQVSAEIVATLKLDELAKILRRKE